MSSVDGSKSLLATSDELISHSCGPCCYGGTSKEATSYCNDCQEYLCTSCTESHKGLKLSRNHKLSPVSDVSARQSPNTGVTSLVLCECSSNAGVVTYCEDHNDVVCQSCHSIKHRKCKTRSINELSATFDKSALDLLAETLVKLKNNFDEILKRTKSNLSGLLSAKEMCKKEIGNFRQEINGFLDFLEQKAIRELEKCEALEKQKMQHIESSSSETNRLREKEMVLLENVIRSSDNINMYAAKVKSSNHIKDYELLLHDLRQEIQTPALTFVRNESLVEIQNNIKELGKMNVDYQMVYSSGLMSFQNIRIDKQSQVEIRFPRDSKQPFISGCVIMPDGKVVMCDQANNAVKVLSSSFAMKGSLQLQSWPRDISVIDKDNVIVTLPGLKQLQYIEINPVLTAGRILQLDKEVWGVEEVNEEIFVTCHNNPGQGEVRVLSKEGGLKRKLGISQDETFMFKGPGYIAVNPKSGNIYVSNFDTDTVTCLKSDGTVLYQYKDSELKYPRGVCVDDEGNIIVCGEDSNNVQIVTADGKKKSNLLSSTDGIKKPLCVALKPDDNKLIVGCYKQNKLYVYEIK